jgi:hypothetical protein
MVQLFNSNTPPISVFSAYSDEFVSGKSAVAKNTVSPGKLIHNNQQREKL